MAKDFARSKKNTKAKVLKNKIHTNGTGGGEALPGLDAIELKVVNLLSPVSMEGLPEVTESTLAFDMEDTCEEVHDVPSLDSVLILNPDQVLLQFK
ncbi:hypothetical protein FQA39_LY03246 [Lamprigera yunnana]|nr:hypothetical protein FQA39_LY03246 [Lamprigera yunnana]